MKVDAFLEQHPDAETLAALKSLAPSAPRPGLDVARLISQQRDSQTRTLARTTVGSRLDGDFQEAGGGRERSHRAPRNRELRDPRKTSALFLATCAQAGAVLRSLDLSGVGDADRALGLLLILVSLAKEAPREREDYRGRWREFGEQAQRVLSDAGSGRTPFGAVLTPMVLEATVSDEPMVDWMVGELVGALADETGRRDLERWTSRTIRLGAARLAEFSAGGLEPVEIVEPQFIHEPEESYRPARESLELSLAGGRSAIRRFLGLLGNLPEVSRISEEIAWEAGGTTVTIWSYVPLRYQHITQLAREADVVIVESGRGDAQPS